MLVGELVCDGVGAWVADDVALGVEVGYVAQTELDIFGLPLMISPLASCPLITEPL